MNVIFSRKDESLFVSWMLSCYFLFSVGRVQGPTEEYKARTRVAAGFDKNDNMGETESTGPGDTSPGLVRATSCGRPHPGPSAPMIAITAGPSG